MTWDATLAMIVNGQRRRRLKLPVCRLWLSSWTPDNRYAVVIEAAWFMPTVGSARIANRN